ncbi:MAG: guanylate kinase [Planctomycetota bacterium]
MSSGTDDVSGSLVVLSGPSGVGKTALSERLIRDGVCTRAITATTRAPRPGERAGVDYVFYADRGTFLEDVAKGEFLEHAEVHGNLYGTPLAPLAARLRNGEVVLLVIDVQGAAALMQRGVEATYVFVAPPSFDELERRLRGRASDTPEALRVRLENARLEMACRDRYDHQVVNDDLDRAVKALAALLARQTKENQQ